MRLSDNPAKRLDELTSDAFRRQLKAMQKTLETARFADLDSPIKTFALYEIASALTRGPLKDFGDVNEWIGTRNGLAAGWVALRVRQLEEGGYLSVSDRGGVQLTDQGVQAARILGIDLDDG
jgi:hypothetical protein